MTRAGILRCILAASAVACAAPATVARTTTAPSPAGSARATLRLEGADQTAGLRRDPAIADALNDVDPARIRRIDSTLVSFGTRNTFSDTMSAARGIGAARRWIFSEFERYNHDCGGCLRVEYNAKVQ